MQPAWHVRSALCFQPPLSANPLGHCTCLTQRQSRLRRAFRHPFLFFLHLSPILLAYIPDFWSRARPPWGPWRPKVTGRWHPGHLLVTSGATFSNFLNIRGEVEKTTNVRITKNHPKWQNQSTLWWPRLVFLSKSNTFEVHLGIDLSTFSKKCKSVK